MFRLTLKAASRSNIVLSDCGRQPALSTVPLLFYRGVSFLPLSVCGKAGTLDILCCSVAFSGLIVIIVVFLADIVTFSRCSVAV